MDTTPWSESDESTFACALRTSTTRSQACIVAHQAHHSLIYLELRGKRAHSLQILQEGAKYIRMLTIQDVEIQRAKAELLKQNQELKAKLAMLSHRSYK